MTTIYMKTFYIRYSLHVKSLTGSDIVNHHDNDSIYSDFGWNI